MEVKEVLHREGRDAKNLLVFQFCEEQPPTDGRQNATGKISPSSLNVRKPPVAPSKSPNSLKNALSPIRSAKLQNAGPRVRSASTGRDKKSELQARYWALLFGNLQRAVNEIYQTVECCENISWCQEAILVLENYVRDFKALSEWFKVSWDFESRPLQQRPHSLAWEVRKSNPAPRVRAKSLTSPTMSGKSSPSACPCTSGKSSPCCGGSSGDSPSPRKSLRACDPLPKGAMRVNVRELFAPSKVRTVNERSIDGSDQKKFTSTEQEVHAEAEPMDLPNRSHQYAQTDLEDDHLTLADIRIKMQREAEERQLAEQAEQERFRKEQELERHRQLEQQQLEQQQQLQQHERERQQAEQKLLEQQQKQHLREENKLVDENLRQEEGKISSATSDINSKQEAIVENGNDSSATDTDDSHFGMHREPTALEMTVQKLNEMENEILLKDANKMPTPPTTELKNVNHIVDNNAAASAGASDNKKDAVAPDSTKKTAVAAPAQNGPLKYSSVLNRPATARTATSIVSKPSITVRPPTAVAPANKPIASQAQKVAPNISLRRSATTASVIKTASVRTAAAVTGAGSRPITTRPSSKTEHYGPPTHVASRLSARSRTMIEMQPKEQKPRDGRQQQQKRNAQTAVASQKSSREDIGSSSSTLKASTELISSSRSSLSQTAAGAVHIDDRRSEPKQLPSDPNDGWLTVKNRRRSSMHWAHRFNQPTGYASLPTLALFNEQLVENEDRQRTKKAAPKKEPPSECNSNNTSNTTQLAPKQAKGVKAQKSVDKPVKNVTRPEIKNAKAKVNSLPTQRKNPPTTAAAQPSPATQCGGGNAHGGVSLARSSTVPTRETIIKRQKSDLTGLKMTSLHKEYMRSEKYVHRKQGGRAGSLESSAANSTETVMDANEEPTNSEKAPDSAESADQNKIDIKIQTNRDFSKTIGDLYESIAQTAKAAGYVGAITGAGKLSSCDENEETFASETDCDEDQRMLVEEQESLERQIRELENTEIDVDTETDETDGEVAFDHEHDCNEAVDRLLDDASSIAFLAAGEDGMDPNISLEMRYHALLSEMSRGEREEALATLQAYVARHPGRAQELHQKLSSPSRRRSLHETLKKYQAKHARAQQKREQVQKEKTIKIQQLLARVEDVKAAKRQLIEDKRLRMEDKMQRAAENREQYLRQIVEKAHDEEKKLKEINFIKNIEAQNKRLDLLESCKDAEGRLQDLEQERQKRLEEKAAREAAVERRRQELEKERQRKLEKMNETRLEKEQRIGKMQEQKERQRQALAREKARDREERLLARQTQQQQTTEELQRKILQKQQDSARRHEENIEHIRQRALELTLPTRNADENGMQRNENGELVAEDGDLSSTVSDVGSREHTRGYKKKMKKLKQRMAQSAEEYMKEQQPVPLHMKRESQVPKYLNLVSKGGGSQGLERAVSQLLRLMSKAQVFDFQCFLLMDGLGVITTNVISKSMLENNDIPKRAVVLAVQLYRNACTLCPQIARHAILGNTLSALFDVLVQSLQLPEEKSPQHPVELSTELMLACTVAMSPSYTKKHTHPQVLERLPDLISYAVIIGLIEILSRRCMKIRESIENHQSVVLSLLATLGFLTRFIDVCPAGPTDATRFLGAAKSTELFGSVSMLYACVVPIGECIPPRTVSLAAATFNLLVSMAVLDLATFQDVMSSETLSLKFLDVVTILLKYCGNKCSAAKNSETQAVIIDLIATIGFLCANNKKNQDLLTSEQCSIIVKSLTKLPEHLNVVVYPCLVTITFQNQNARNVIARDFNLEFLDEYSKSEKAKKNHLIALLKEKT
ncbi:calponin homology domain-containing protein DDB_G0272472 isoform X1 [Rhagoletis pomonella]|uniref:calponin homology domain-containing protein DDB_G0272472 isoform X1 n=1 Tax=Rhagoletis pomonella TaxID=28610 RepID=UPI001783554C|nr:calponin homology domain-containing protein DDB_G0272472 isoform X1 [Rhagoletis pomonella]